MRRNREAGQTLVFVALGMVMLGAILGLAIDLGYMRFLKRQMQTAADSAAIAGAAEINYGDVTSAAKADAASNGFTDGTNGVTVTVNNPPASGPNQGLSGYVEVLISKNQPTFFIRIVPGGATNSTVQARAVGYLGSAKGCMYSLQSSPGGMTIGTPGRHGGGVDVTAQNCAIIDNGNLTVNGRADNVSASAIGVAGTVNRSRSSITPTPQQGMVPASDPLAFLPTQNPGNCDFTNFSINSGTQILSQGVYCGGINITGTANVTFNSGLYIMMPNGITNNGLIISGSGNVSGNGVTFYNGANSGAVSITNTATVSLTAPTSGNYAGVLIFQDPNNGLNATVDGGNNSLFQGALYFPNLNTTLTIDDIGSSAAYTILVAGSLDIRGNNNTIGSNYSSLSNGSPIKDAVLVE
jgi:Putative Flp pilus-assembly TadE/G-like